MLTPQILLTIQRRFCRRVALGLGVFSITIAALHADDWPQWLGPKRDGVWRETGIVELVLQFHCYILSYGNGHVTLNEL